MKGDDKMNQYEKKIYDLSLHYDMFARRVRKGTGYSSLSPKDPMNHKNWKFFVKVHELCVQNGWDEKLYIEYAFIHVSTYWKKAPYPIPSQLCSENIQKSFVIWKDKEDKKHAHSLKTSERKASKTIGFYDEIKSSISKSIERVKYEMSVYSDSFSPEISKVMVILDNLDVLSSTYLYSIDYVRNELIHDLNYENNSMVELRQDFSVFTRSNKVSSFIFNEVAVQEQLNNIPQNITLKEFNDYARSLGE